MTKWKCPTCSSHSISVVGLVLLHLIQHKDKDEFKTIPDQFVVRKATIGAGTVLMHDPPHALKDPLEEARATVPSGLTNIGRHESDDPVIVEVWL